VSAEVKQFFGMPPEQRLQFLLPYYVKYMNEQTIKNYNADTYTSKTENNFFTVQRKDAFAYDKYSRMSQPERSQKYVGNIEEFFCDYMDITKVGCYIGHKSGHKQFGIVTTDPTPHITHEDLVRENKMKICHFDYKVDFDPERDDFVHIPQTADQKELDEIKKKEIEADLGIKF
jgi:hypothetical protein